MKSNLLFSILLVLLSGQLFAQLSQSSQNDLQFMREKEKLAQDVYTQLGKKWDLTPFHHMRVNEQEHMNKIGELLTDFNIKDPYVSTGNTPGVFKSKDLQKLYNKLVTQGEKSLADALNAGAFIEESKISELDAAIGRADNQRVIKVFQGLKEDAENHLRAFVRNIEADGGNYQPKVLTAERYEAVLYPSTSDCEKNKQGNKNCCGKKGQAASKGRCCASK